MQYFFAAEFTENSERHGESFVIGEKIFLSIKASSSCGAYVRDKRGNLPLYD